MPEVYSIVRSIAQRMGMPVPRIDFIESPQPNAFATGRNPRDAAVAVTRGMIDMMSYQELEAVFAHELSHVKNRDILILIGSIAATIGAARCPSSHGWRSGIARAPQQQRSRWGDCRVGGNHHRSIGCGNHPHGDQQGPRVRRRPIWRHHHRLAIGARWALQKLDRGTARIPMDVGAPASTLFIADPYRALSAKQRQQLRFSRMFSTHPPIPERLERLEEMVTGIR